MYCDYNEFMTKLRALETRYALTSDLNERNKRLANMYKDTISMFESASKLSEDEASFFMNDIFLVMGSSMKYIANK